MAAMRRRWGELELKLLQLHVTNHQPDLGRNITFYLKNIQVILHGSPPPRLDCGRFQMHGFEFQDSNPFFLNTYAHTCKHCDKTTDNITSPEETL